MTKTHEMVSTKKHYGPNEIELQTFLLSYLQVDNKRPSRA